MKFGQILLQLSTIMRLLKDPARDRVRAGAVGLGLLGVTIVLYGQILDNYFLNDDFGRILALQELQNSPVGDAFIALFMNSYHGAYYRPFTNISFYLLRTFSGLEAWAYYLSSLLLHVLAATCLYACLERLRKYADLGSPLWCFVVPVFLFLINPRHVESVSYIHDNENIICGLFFFLGFYGFAGYCTRQKTTDLFIFSLCYLCSLLGKEMGVTLPLVCIAYYAILIWSQNAGEKKTIYKDPILVKTMLVATLVFCIYMVLRYQGLGEWIGGAGPTSQLSFSPQRLARTIVQGFAAMIIPNGLPILGAAADYFRDHIGLFIAVSTLMIGLSLWFLRKFKSRIFWFGLSWSVLSLLPVLNNGIGVDILTGGRYLYIPLAGVSIGMTVVLSHFAGRKWLVLAILFVAAFYSFHTYKNNTAMVYISKVSERFLKGIGDSWRENKDGHVAIIVPGMYRGLYMLPGAFANSLKLIYGKESTAILESVGMQLTFAIEDHKQFQMEIVEGEGRRTLVFSGGGILWKPELYDLEASKQVNLEFKKKKMLNTQGDFLARQVSLDILGAIWVPAFTKKNDNVYVLPQ